jgi:hypothetical protein
MDRNRSLKALHVLSEKITEEEENSMHLPIMLVSKGVIGHGKD